jgi:hypothetical protein
MSHEEKCNCEGEWRVCSNEVLNWIFTEALMEKKFR